MSNVFNDVMELDSGDGNITLLKGIAARSDVGFLSLFEHYNVCQVPGQVSGTRSRLPAASEEGGEGELWARGFAAVRYPALDPHPEPADAMFWGRSLERDSGL